MVFGQLSLKGKIIKNSPSWKNRDIVSYFGMFVILSLSLLSSNVGFYALGQPQTNPQLWTYCNADTGIHILYPVGWNVAEEPNRVHFQSPDGVHMLLSLLRLIVS